MPVYDLTYDPARERGVRFAWTIPAAGTAPVPAVPATYEHYATWNNYDITASPNNASGTSGGADYYAGSGTSGNYRASLFVNITPNATGTGYTAISANTVPAGTYRLRRVGGGLTGNVPGFIIGTVGIRQPDNSGRRALVVSPTATTNPNNQFSTENIQRSQDMTEAFGTGTPSNAGTWVLERQTSAGTPEIPGTQEDEYRLIRRGSTNMWVRRANLQNGDFIFYTYNTDGTAGSRLGIRQVLPANQLLLENGQPLQAENGEYLEFDDND